VERYGWTVDRDDYDLEVTVQLNDCWLLVGLPLFRELAARDYDTVGLRSTVGYALTAVAQEFLQPGSLIVDPMAGVGTVLIEGCRAFPQHRYLGGDTDPAQLGKFAENVRVTGLESKIGIVFWDATRLPLRSNSVDCIAVDAPFGRKYGTPEQLPSLYRKLLLEFGRVLRPRGCLSLLTGTFGAKLIDDFVHAKTELATSFPPPSCESSTASACVDSFPFVYAIRRRLELKLGALYAVLFLLVKVPRGEVRRRSFLF